MSTIAPAAPPAGSPAGPWYGLSGDEACGALDACLVAVIGYLALAEIGTFIVRHVHKGALA